MRDDELFEARLGEAFARYASEMPTRVDAPAVARRVAAERSRLAWRSPIEASRQPVWVLLIAALLLALLGALAVGARLLRPTIPPDAAAGITVLARSENSGLTPAVVGTSDEVWFLPGSGLVRYEPATGETRLWTAADDLAFAGSLLAPARDGGVWLANWMGGPIHRFDGEHIVTTIQPPSNGTVAALFETSDGVVWVSIDGAGLLRWSNGGWSTVTGLPEGATVVVLAQARDGSVWASLLRYPGPSSVGVARFDGNRWAMYTQDASGMPLDDVYSLAADPSGAMWAGTSGGLMRFDGRAWQHVGQELPGGDGPAWRPVVGADGTVWAGQDLADAPVTATVARRRGDTWRTWGPADGLSDAAPAGQGMGASVVVTSRGPVVVSSSGLYRLVGDRWQVVWRDQQPSYGRILGVAPAGGAEAWLRASTEGGMPALWHVTASGGTLESLPSGSRAVNGIVLGSDGEPWVATEAGLLTREGGRWRTVDDSAASAVTVAGDGSVWAVRSSAEVVHIRRSGGGWTVDVLPARPGTLPTAATGRLGPRLAIDHVGGVWLTGGGVGYSNEPGLWRYFGGAWALAGPSADQASGIVFGNLQAAPDGAVWVTLDGSRSSCCIPPDPRAGGAMEGRHLDGIRQADRSARGDVRAEPGDDAGGRRLAVVVGRPVPLRRRDRLMEPRCRWLLLRGDRRRA